MARYGLLPPHPANPPTKRPTVALMKQGRAFGVGVARGYRRRPRLERYPDPTNGVR